MHTLLPYTTKGPMWGYPRPVLGAVDPFLEPFRGRLSPNIDNVSEQMTLRYPHEGPWVEVPHAWRGKKLSRCHMPGGVYQHVREPPS